MRRRTWPSRRQAPVGMAARRRIRAGGPQATGRPAATVAEWRAIRETVLARAHWVCQACGTCARLEIHHVLKRAQGGSDFDLDHLVALCRRCHTRTDAPYAQGRLMVTVLGGGRFVFELVQGPGKGTADVVDRWNSLWPLKAGEDGIGAVPVFAHVGKAQGTPQGLRSPALRLTHIIHTGVGTAFRPSLSCMIDGNDPSEPPASRH